MNAELEESKPLAPIAHRERLTEQQARVLATIGEWINRTGGSPTRAEIARAMNFRSANAAEEHIRVLERKGYITILKGQQRGIRITGGSTLTQSIAKLCFIAESVAHLQGREREILEYTERVREWLKGQGVS